MSRVVVNKPEPLDPALVKERDGLQLAFGKHLRSLRTDKNQTLEMLAEGAGLHANYVGSVERGERNLSLFNIWRMAVALDVPASDLLAGLPSHRHGKVLKKR